MEIIEYLKSYLFNYWWNYEEDSDTRGKISIAYYIKDGDYKRLEQLLNDKKDFVLRCVKVLKRGECPPEGHYAIIIEERGLSGLIEEYGDKVKITKRLYWYVKFLEEEHRKASDLYEKSGMDSYHLGLMQGLAYAQETFIDDVVGWDEFIKYDKAHDNILETNEINP
jgi:hypothetical protein